MTTYLFANNARSTLASPMTTSATTAVLATGSGSLFPNPSTGQAFTLSLLDKATGTVTEIMLCTARSGDSLTVTRAQEGTSAAAWLAGDFANNFITAGTAAAFQQAANTNTPIGGATSARPGSPPLYQTYFDTTLGQPIFASQITPSVVWVNSAGVAV